MDDRAFMERALALAEASVGLASPNPQVGCVLVRDRNLLGEGAHRYEQFDHAEVVALKQARAAGHDPRGATAYVTLEPCSHHGRTGPCADALIAAGISRCVIATGDPNPAVSGRGFARLRAAGVAVEVGPGQSQARRLNDAFATSITLDRPFVTLKAGLSLDGMLAPAAALRSVRAPVFLTGPESRAEVQRLRHASDAIMTGIGTVLADDPLLTDRTGEPRRRPLLRVVLDSSLRLPLHAKLIADAPETVLIFCSQQAAPDREAALTAAGAKVFRVDADCGWLDLNQILSQLHRMQVISVLLEAGSSLNGAFLRACLVDRAILYYAALALGTDAIPFADRFTTPFALEQAMKQVERRGIGADRCVSGLLRDPWGLL